MTERKRVKGKELSEHPLVAKLITDPENIPEFKILIGFLGKSASAGKWRLYLNGLLNEYVEFSEEDLLHQASPTGSTATVVWLLKSAVLQHTKLGSSSGQASFLSGNILNAYSSHLGAENLLGRSGLRMQRMMDVPTGLYCPSQYMPGGCEPTGWICATISITLSIEFCTVTLTTTTVTVTV